MNDRRSSERYDSRMTIELTLDGTIHQAQLVNLSMDGILVRLIDVPFAIADLKSTIELQSASGKQDSLIKPRAELVRLFDGDGQQVAALRFCE